MSRPKTEPSTHQIVSVRFPVDVWEACHEVAAAEDRSLNEQLLRITKEWFADKKGKQFASARSRNHRHQ